MIKRLFWTDSTQTEYSFFKRAENEIYGFKFLGIKTTQAPTNFNYEKRIDEMITELNNTNKKSLNFEMPACLETIQYDNEKVFCTFILPGPINQTFKIQIDSRDAAKAGQIGLNISFNIKRLT